MKREISRSGFMQSWFKVFVLLIFCLSLAACGGGGGDDSPKTVTPPGGGQATPKQGVFIDSAVEGLRYITPTQDSFTDINGTFSYMAGEEVRFFIGGIFIGSALGKAILTPVDFVPGAVDETNPQVTNIARFLQTLDEDNDTSNGIKIIREVSERAEDMSLCPLCYGSISEFETSVGMLDILSDLTSTLGAARNLIPAATAQSHLRDTLGGGGSTGNFGSLSITGAGTAITGTTYIPNFRSGSVEEIPEIGGFGILTWSNNGSTFSDGELLGLSILGETGGMGIRFISQTVLSPPPSLVIQTVHYSLGCTFLEFSPECDKVSVDTTAKTITFNNAQLELSSVSSDVIIDPGPIVLNGTLVWQ